jgi:hypothetical protein
MATTIRAAPQSRCFRLEGAAHPTTLTEAHFASRLFEFEFELESYVWEGQSEGGGCSRPRAKRAAT